MHIIKKLKHTIRIEGQDLHPFSCILTVPVIAQNKIVHFVFLPTRLTQSGYKNKNNQNKIKINKAQIKKFRKMRTCE